MDDALTAIRRDITEGRISAQSLVSLFNAVTNAGHEGDHLALAEGRGIAEQLTASAPPELVDDARRLLEHCDELLRNNSASSPQTETSPSTCPSCGREVPSHAIRCRGCGELFV